ncbi:MAG: fibronectin type III domain-containing protein [Bacteroidota bacterium]
MQLSLTTNSLLIIIFFILSNSSSIEAQITVDRFMGVNTLREDPVERMKAVGFIREYHNWFLNEGNPTPSGTGFSPSYPDAVYRWNKVYQDLTFTRFGPFYEEIRNVHDIQIAPAFLGNLFQIVDPSRTTYQADNHIVQEQIPVVSGANTLDPAAYKAHAAYLYHYAARYGHNTFNISDFNTLIVPRTHPEETPKTGLGLVEYMESWNEQDKWWWQGSHPNTYFEPEEYATMLSADYDGHGNSLGVGIGIKNADPNMKVVMGGLAEANLSYIRKMVDWAKANRSASFPHGILPFQVLNIHHYIGNNPNFLQSTQGVSPERANLRAFLKTFDTYRDSLNAVFGGNLELWLSEFGYDTYGEGATGNPVVIAPQIGPNDSYEVQGQWITRIYLAALAAEIDRAILFFLRDEQTPYTGLYTSSGLLENAANNYKPKNSWFYTYTMKNVLTDMVFEADVSPCSDTTCVWIYKFKHVNSSNPKKVYAIWNPTSSAKVTHYEFTQDELEDQVLVEMELPSIYGVQFTFSEDYPTIKVTEKPAFIIKDGNYFTPPSSCVASPSVENATCSSISVRLNAPANSGTYQLWYMEGSFSALDFSHRLATLVNENLSAGDSVVTVANLKSEQSYTFFLFPAGVGECDTDKICTVTGVTTDQSCKIPINPAWIFDDYKNTVNPDGLFDNQHDSDPMCDPNASFPNQNDLWGFNYDLSDSMNISVDLQAYYYLDAITLHDEGSRGFLTIQTADSPNGPWTTVTDYLTIDFNVWKTLTNVFPNHDPIRYLRFIAEKSDAAKVGEVFLCGRLSNFAPDIRPGKPVNGTIASVTCQSMVLSWNAPFDPDVQGYKIIRNGGTPLTINIPGDQTFPVNGLVENTLYEFDILTVDMAGQESTDTLKMSATTQGGIDQCKIPLNNSMIFDFFEDLSNAQKLINEQNDYDPICHPSNVPTDFWGPDFSHTGEEQVSFDLQAYYDIDKIIIHDGGGIAGNLKIQKADSPNGPWTTVVDYNTVKFNDWITFEEPGMGLVRYLRFVASPDDNVATGEIFICGTVDNTFNPNIRPGKGKNGAIYDIACDSVGLAWEHPFDKDIKEYLVLGGSTPLTVPYSAMENPSVSVKNLTTATDYIFKIVTKDFADQASDTLYLAATTFADGECDLECAFFCDCALCIRPSWITNLTPTVNYRYQNLFDDPEKVPFCGTPGSSIAGDNFWGDIDFLPTGAPPSIIQIDLPELYQIDLFHYFSGGNNPGNFTAEYLDADDNWQEFINVQTGSYSWQKYDEAPFVTQSLRLSLLDVNARIGEIGICGTPINSCPTNLIINDPVTQTDTFRAGNIIASTPISANLTVGYLAENVITLTPGFESAFSSFIAEITDCPSNGEGVLAFDHFSKTTLTSPLSNITPTLSVYPNPFQYTTTLAFETSEDLEVQLDILNSNGQVMQTLVSQREMPKGQHQVHYQRTEQDGGFYIARLQMGAEVYLRKLILIK